MNSRWLFILAALLIVIISLSLLFSRISHKMLPLLEEENTVSQQRPILSEPQDAPTAILPSAPLVQVSRAVTMASKPAPAKEEKAQSVSEIIRPYASASASAPSVSASADEKAEQKAGVTREGKEATPEEIVKIRSKGIIIQ